jgi:CDP-glycerol glycerophosphotransferase (TagB/SpsB family)
MKNRFLYAIKKIVDIIPIIFLPIYWLSYLMPRNKKIWVFGSNLGKAFADNPKYFYLYINSLKESDIRAIWITPKEDIVKNLRKNNLEVYNIYSLKGIYYTLRAKNYIFDHHSKDISFWFSGGANKINLFHGIPLKKIHNDNKFDRVRNPSNLWDRIRWTFRRIQNEKPYHYYLSTSEYVKDIFKKAFKAKEENFFICGYPRNDTFFQNDYIKKYKSLIIKNKNIYKTIIEYKKENYKIIMYMPTFRDSEKKLFDIVDFEEFNNFLKNNKYILLIKAHPMSKLQEKMNNINYSNIININSKEDPYVFTALTDMLITDYSSIYFDYLLTKNPIVFFPYDLKEYMSGSRELYYDYDNVTPGYKAYDIQGLKEGIKMSFEKNDSYIEKRKEVLNKNFDYYDGNSSKRLYEKLNNTFI